MFHLFSLTSFSLICIFFSSIIIVDCYLLIHESNVWIPIFNNSYRAPYFFFTDDKFYTTNYSNQVLNTDPNAVGEQSSVTRFAPAYSRRPNYDNYYFLHRKGGHINYAFYNYTENGFQLNAEFSQQMYLGAHRWLSINDSFYEIAIVAGLNITNSEAHIYSIARSYSESIFLGYYGRSPVEPTVRSFEILQVFKFREKIYSFGLLTIDLLMPVYFISQLSIISYNGLDSVSICVQSYLHSISLYDRYGPIEKVRFVDSFSIMSNGSSFSLIAFSYNRNESHHIAVIPFNLMLDDFERPINGCQTTRTFWQADLFSESGPECNSYLGPDRCTMWSKRIDFRGYHLTGILSGDWTRIVDFVPLALDATPGYIFLVLSSNSNFTRYRYSIHFVDENYSVLPNPNETTFTHPNIQNADRTISQIYYYGFTHPRVIITLNQYSYYESIILCPFLNNSCIDCFTTKVYNPNGNFLRYCQWRRGNSLTSGECSIGDTNSANSRETTFWNQTVNPCFSLTNIQVDYSSDEPTFNLNFDLLGFHSRYENIFPLTFTLVNITTLSFIENCTVMSYNQSKIYLNCNWVNSGQYQLSILMLRRRGPFETGDIDNLITYSDPFTIGTPSREGMLIILLVIAFIISMIAFVVFYTRRTEVRKVPNTMVETKNLPSKGSLPDIRSKHKSSLDLKSKSVVIPTVHLKSKSVPILKVRSSELISKKTTSIDPQVPKKNPSKTKTIATPKQTKRTRNESLQSKAKR